MYAPKTMDIYHDPKFREVELREDGNLIFIQTFDNVVTVYSSSAMVRVNTMRVYNNYAPSSFLHGRRNDTGVGCK